MKGMSGIFLIGIGLGGLVYAINADGSIWWLILFFGIFGVGLDLRIKHLIKEANSSD